MPNLYCISGQSEMISALHQQLKHEKIICRERYDDPQAAQSLMILTTESETIDLGLYDERDYLCTAVMCDGTYNMSGLQTNTSFEHDFKVTITLALDRLIKDIFAEFLCENPFEYFRHAASDEVNGDIYYHMTALSLSNHYRDIHHDVPNFILHSGQHVFDKSYTELFGETMDILTYGGYVPQQNISVQAHIIFIHPITKVEAQIDRQGNISWSHN